MNDLYLTELDAARALTALRRLADVMLNGGEYEPVGHEAADSMIEGLLRRSRRGS